METEQNDGDVSPDDAGKNQRRKTHEKLEEVAARVDDEAINAGLVGDQGDEQLAGGGDATARRNRPDGSRSVDAGGQRPVDVVWNVAVDGELVQQATHAEQKNSGVAQQREVQRSFNVAFQLVTRRLLLRVQLHAATSD